MIPGHHKADSTGQGTQHQKHDELNRGRMDYIRWGILTNLEVCPMHLDVEMNDYMITHMPYFQKRGFAVFNDDAWRITDKGLQALKVYRDNQ